MRISFLGGTTDFSEFFLKSNLPGRVIGCSIDKYVYVNILQQPKYEEFNYRFAWRITELVKDLNSISHPVVRNVLRTYKVSSPLNISTMASLPARSGLGSSSAFTVSLIAALRKLQKLEIKSKAELALECIRVEREILGEPGGWQDQFHASVGGLRMYEFNPEGVKVSDQIRSKNFRKLLGEHIVLISTGGVRDSFKYSEITSSNLKNDSYRVYLEELSSLVLNTHKEIVESVTDHKAINALVDGISTGWKLKKILTSHSETHIDEIIDFGLRMGAKTGKLCGAGGNGFAMFIVDPVAKEHFLKNFDSKLIIPTSISETGHEIFEL